MLTISKALSASQAQSYHKLEFTSDAQTYYKEGDTVKGEWQGKLAASLGLSGEVSPLEFHRLSEGMHPQTEEQMVKHRLAHLVEPARHGMRGPAPSGSSSVHFGRLRVWRGQKYRRSIRR